MLAFHVDNNQVEKISGLTVEYPYTMHERDISEFTVPWHWHEELELNYVKSGTLKVTSATAEYLIHENEAFFVNTNVMLTKEAVPTDDTHTVEITHLFHPVFLSGHFQSLFETKYLDPVLKNRGIEIVIFRDTTENGRKMLSLLKEAEALFRKENCEFQIRSTLSSAWLVLMQEIRENETNIPTPTLASQERIRYMLSYIHLHYAEKITLADIAGSAAIGEREALRCFQKTLKRSPFDYLTEYRLSVAQKLLVESDHQITEIAFETGFSDSAYFGKVFRKKFSMTPKSYRTQFAGANN